MKSAILCTLLCLFDAATIKIPDTSAAVQELNPKALDYIIKPGTDWAVLWYATWSKEAPQVLQEFNKFGDLMAIEQPNLRVGRCDITKARKAVEHLQISGVLSMTLFSGGGFLGESVARNNFAGIGTMSSWFTFMKRAGWRDPPMEITYFGTRGRAEAVRLTLEVAGKTQYTEKVVGADWPEVKQAGIDSGELTFGQLPLLKIGERPFVQSAVIVRHLGVEYDLYPMIYEYGNLHEMREQCVAVDTVMAGAEDLRTQYGKLVYNPNFANEKASYVSEILPTWLGHFERLLERANGQWFVGEEISVADIEVFDVLAANHGVNPDCLAEFPRLKQFYRTFLQLPSIKAYVTSSRRPAHQNGKSAYFDNAANPSTYWDSWLDDFPCEGAGDGSGRCSE